MTFNCLGLSENPENFTKVFKEAWKNNKMFQLVLNIKVFEKTTAQNDPVDIWISVSTTPAEISSLFPQLVCHFCVVFHSQASSRLSLTSSLPTAVVQ